MVSRVISPLDYRREPWPNGLGWTREICRFGDEERRDWRLSIAEIDADAPFSKFAGIDRELALLSGNALLCGGGGRDASVSFQGSQYTSRR